MRLKPIIFISMFLVYSCSPGGGGSKTDSKGAASSGSVSSASVLDVPLSGDPTTLAAQTTSVGIRGFDEINVTMSVLTGISGNATINNRFETLKAKLPVDNDIKTYSFSIQNAVYTLAAEYCNTLVNTATYAPERELAIGVFNTAAIPTVAFAGNARTNVANNLLVRFWGTNYLAEPIFESSKTQLVTLMIELNAGEPDTAVTTRKVLVGACTSALSSMPVTML
jgi:hypothetical protein